jgi:hypothetical protein
MTDPTQVPMTSQPRQTPLRPEEAVAPGEGTVTMVFPKPVNLTTNDGRLVRFNSGINEVPESLADHEYLHLSGVKKHDKSSAGWRNKLKPQPSKASATMTQHHVDFMRSSGVDVADIMDAQRQFDALSAEEQQEFLEDSGDFVQNSQYVLQRRVQDREAGAKRPAPPNPNQKEEPGGPQPSSVHELIQEGSVAGRGQVGRRDLEFEGSHPGSFNRGMELPEKAKQPEEQPMPAAPATGRAAAPGIKQATTAGQQVQRSTTSSASKPENKGTAKTEDKK